MMSSILPLFASDVLVKILTLFLLNPEQAYYQAEIHQQLGGTLRNTQKMLLRLEQMELIRHYKRGKMSYYRANREHFLFEDLKRLLIKSVGLGDLLRETIQSVADKVQLAFVFGSYARGEEAVHSDIDLFMMGNLSLREVSEIMGPVTETLGREVNSVIYTEAEFQKRYADHNHFVRELVSCPKIWLIGSNHDLEAVVE
jgi:predicted nucleotidyltransferase